MTSASLEQSRSRAQAQEWTTQRIDRRAQPNGDAGPVWAKIMTAWKRRYRETRDVHFLTQEGMVACNPRDREAAHRAEFKDIATEDIRSVTCETLA
jgi:hypothetical protein